MLKLVANQLKSFVFVTVGYNSNLHQFSILDVYYFFFKYLIANSTLAILRKWNLVPILLKKQDKLVLSPFFNYLRPRMCSSESWIIFNLFLLKNRKKMTLVILVFKFILTSLGHFWSFRINGFVFQDSELRQPLCGRNSLNIQRQPSAARPSYDNVRHSRISSKHSAAVVNNMK